MVKPEKFGHLHLVYHFTVPLRVLSQVNEPLCLTRGYITVLMVYA